MKNITSTFGNYLYGEQKPQTQSANLIRGDKMFNAGALKRKLLNPRQNNNIKIGRFLGV